MLDSRQRLSVTTASVTDATAIVRAAIPGANTTQTFATDLSKAFMGAQVANSSSSSSVSAVLATAVLTLLQELVSGASDDDITLGTATTAASAVELVAPLPLTEAEQHIALAVLRR